MANSGIKPPSKAKKRGSDYFGSANFHHSSPDIAAKGVKSVNLALTFEEGLKLQLALSTCLHALSRYDRGRREGRARGVVLSIKTGNSSIAIIEDAVQ